MVRSLYSAACQGVSITAESVCANCKGARAGDRERISTYPASVLDEIVIEAGSRKSGSLNVQV